MVGAGVFSIARNFAQATGIYGAIIACAENKPFVGVVEEAFGLKKLRVVEAGGSDYEASGRNGTAAPTSFCASPGVVYAYDHNTHTNTVLAQGGIEVITIVGAELGSGAAADAA